MSRYQDLVAWQKAMNVVERVYLVTDSFPQREIYGLTSQMRRAAVSVPSNIAEGQAHYTNPEFCRFLRLARGSLAELETQLMIAERLRYAEAAEAKCLLSQVDEVSRIISGLISSLQVDK
jgi:four helix bundle protein